MQFQGRTGEAFNPLGECGLASQIHLNRRAKSGAVTISGETLSVPLFSGRVRFALGETK